MVNWSVEQKCKILFRDFQKDDFGTSLRRPLNVLQWIFWKCQRKDFPGRLVRDVKCECPWDVRWWRLQDVTWALPCDRQMWTFPEWLNRMFMERSKNVEYRHHLDILGPIFSSWLNVVHKYIRIRTTFIHNENNIQQSIESLVS